jgi:hypothetical protein
MIILYERFANKENIEAKLTELNLAEHEKAHLLDLLAKIYQQHLLAGMLEMLETDDRPLFLEKFYYSSEKEVINFLQDRVETLNEKISQLVTELELEVFNMLERS